MDNKEIKIYNADLGLDGTIEELLDWAYRYDSDYTDEALDEIAEQAKALGLPEEQYMIPVLVKNGRNRSEDTLPYESMKLDKLRDGRISYSETKDYGKVEIREEGDKVLISVIGVDDEGSFSAASAFSVDEFMGGEAGWLEQAIGSILFYGKVYED